MDILKTILDAIGFMLSIGIAAIIPVVFVFAIFKKIRWMIASLIMTGVAAVASYPMGFISGMETERVAWEHEMKKLKQTKRNNEQKARIELRTAENKYIASQVVAKQFNEEREKLRNDLLDAHNLIDNNPGPSSPVPAHISPLDYQLNNKFLEAIR